MQSHLIDFVEALCAHICEAIQLATSTSSYHRDRLQALYSAVLQFSLSLLKQDSTQHIASVQSAIGSVLKPSIYLSWPLPEPPSLGDAAAELFQIDIISGLTNPGLILFRLSDDDFENCMNRIKDARAFTEASSHEHYLGFQGLERQSRRENEEEKVLADILSSQISNNSVRIDPKQKGDYLRLSDVWNEDEEAEHVKFEILFKNRRRVNQCIDDCLHETEIHVHKHRETCSNSKRKNFNDSIDEFTLLEDHIPHGHNRRLLFSIEQSPDYDLYANGIETRLLRKADANGSVSISPPLSDLRELQKLSPFQKIALAYALSLSFWRYYYTDFMQALWTCQDIRLVSSLVQHTPGSTDQANNHPGYRAAVESIHPYAALRISRFRHITEPWKHEPLQKSYYPFIIALGVTLMDIGIGRHFTPNASARFDAANAYEYRRYGFECLSNPSWVSSESLHPSYAEAVKSCFHAKKWELKGDASNHDGRRALLYTDVVKPLENIFSAVFLSDNPEIPPGMSPPSPNEEEEYNPYQHTKYLDFIQNIINQAAGPDPTSTKFALAAANILKHEFLEMHDEIFTPDVMESLEPVRICVLDTGCDDKADYFDEFPADRNRITWTDYVYVQNRSERVDVDEDKHGTNIATLLLMLLPHARIYVSRIAEKRSHFKQSAMLSTVCDNATKALNDARHLHHADIVCMSWGLTKTHEGIENAIHESRSEMIFFAATNNQGRREPPLFPSNISSRTGVIPVRGADAKDNKVSDYCPDPAGQFPSYLMALSQKVPCGYSLMDGCSVAVPIMAATAAMILQSVSVMQKENPKLKRRFEGVYSERGIREIFEKSFQDPIDGYQCIRPGRIFTRDVLKDILVDNDWYSLEIKITNPLNSIRVI